MKKKLLLSVCFLVSVFTGYSQVKPVNESNKILSKKEAKKLQKKYAKFVASSPFRKTLTMDRAERSLVGLPPNKYFEQEWLLTMDPSTGRRHPERATLIQEKLNNERLNSRTPGDAADNAWIERGPNNVGGRTRVILFDPNDATSKRVFAGSASGGLWVTNDITLAGATWTRVASVPGNLNVSCITVDPNNSNIWYLGTGEQYTGGDAVGNGVYKTTDGGTTWTSVPVNYTGTTFNFNATNIFLAGIYYVNDIIARNNAGTTEVYIGVGSTIYGAANPNQWSGVEQAGLYKTTNGGTTWTRNEGAAMVVTTSGGKNYYAIPNDLELDINNNIWFSGTTNPFGNGGGTIYRSTDGNTFTLVRTLTGARRTELEPSGTNANKFYVLYQTTATGTPPAIGVTTDAFATTPTVITQPDDADTGIPATDFTRGQAFYDLVIEADPTNDANVYIGGIDLFRSTDSGASWTQISKWSNNNNLAALNCSLVHADQHAFSFRPGFPNQAVSGNDGGISYCSSLSTAGTTATFTTKNSNYNVTQFYSLGVAPTQAVSGLANDYFVAGAQDNGTQYFANKTTAAVASSVAAQGGDGAYSFFDQDNGQYYITNYVYNASINYRTTAGGSSVINSETSSNGAFICPMALDSNLNILYSDYTTTTPTYQIRRYSGLGGTVTKTLLTNALLTASPTALRVSKYTTTSTKMLVGTDNGKVLLITNADGATPTWTDISSASFVGSVSDVEFGQNEDQIFVTFHNYGVTSIWYTNNGTAATPTWSSIEGNFPDIPVKCILQNPLNTAELIIGTELGVWNTIAFNPASNSTQALSWNQSYNGMSDVKVLDLQLQTASGVPAAYNVYAATYGRGVFSGQFKAPSLSVHGNDFVNVDNSIKVYPTISKGNVTISSDKAYGTTKLALFDLSGKRVFENNISILTNSNEVNFGKLSSGEYILKLSGEGFEVAKKLIIE